MKRDDKFVHTQKVSEKKVTYSDVIFDVIRKQQYQNLVDEELQLFSNIKYIQTE